MRKTQILMNKPVYLRYANDYDYVNDMVMIW